MLIASTITIPSNIQLLFDVAGLIRPTASVTVTINGPITAGAWQIFDISNSGVAFTGLFKNSACYTEWFGARADGATVNDAYFQATAAFAHGAGDVPVQLLTGTYKLLTQIIANGPLVGAATAPSWYGASQQTTFLSYAGITAGNAALKFLGGSGATCGATVENIRFVGDSTSIAVIFAGQCGVRVINCFIDTNAFGFKWHNELSGHFTEYCTVERTTVRSTCVTAGWYHVTAGNNSFHGSGFDQRCTINASSVGPVIQVDSGCAVYNAPLDAQVWQTSSSMALINSAATTAKPTLGGFLTLEVGSSNVVTLASGQAVFFTGKVRLNGLTIATGASVVAGTFVRCETASIHADGSNSFTGAVANQYIPSLTSGTTQITSNIRSVHRTVDVNIVAANYAKRYTLDVDFVSGAALAPIMLNSTYRYSFDSNTWGSPTFTGNTDGSFNVVAPTVNLTYTSSFVGGETSATLTAAWVRPTGIYNCGFSSGEVRPVSCTSGSAAVSWPTALSLAATTAGVFSSFTTTGVQCYVSETQVSNGVQQGGHIQF